MNTALTNKQISFVVFCIMVGYGAMNATKIIAEQAGTGVWISIIITTVAISILGYIFTYLGYKHENQTIFEYSQFLMGKPIAYILMSIYIVFFFIYSSMLTRMSTEIIKLTALLRTPTWALNGTFFIIIYYIIMKELKVIGRLCEVYGLITIIIGIILRMLMFSKGKVIYMRPFIPANSIFSYIKASLLSIYPFLGVSIIGIIPFNKENKTKKVFKYVLGSIIFVGIFYILIAEASISIMSADEIVNYEDALFAAVRRTDVTWLQILRRLDGLFLIIWLMAVFCMLTLYCYATTCIINKFLHNKNIKITTFIAILIMFIASILPSSNYVTKKIFEFGIYLGALTVVIIPLILFILTKVKKYEKNT